MFLKIKVRSELLRVFSGVGFVRNAYSVDPLCNYLYYEHLNNWLPIISRYSEVIEARNTNEIVQTLLHYALVGYCPQKFEIELEKSESGIIRNAIDESLKEHIKSLDTYDKLTTLYGLSMR